MSALVRKSPELCESYKELLNEWGRVAIPRAQAGSRDFSWNNDILAEAFFWTPVTLADKKEKPVSWRWEIQEVFWEMFSDASLGSGHQEGNPVHTVVSGSGGSRGSVEYSSGSVRFL